MPIKVEGQFNFITIDGAQAEVSADSVRGDITIKGGTGFVTAKSIEGEIVVEGARGKVNVSSVNQGIKISDTSGDITAESVNGPIAMTGIQSSSVEASTDERQHHLRGQPDRRRALHDDDTQRRPADGVPENASATFTVRTYNGEFRTDLPLEGRIPPEEIHRGKRVTMTLGKGSADVTLESFGGTIRLRKGTASPSTRTGLDALAGGPQRRTGPPPRRVPAGGQQRGLKVLRPPDERERIHEQLDFLTAVRMGNDQLVGVTVGLVANFVVQA